MKKAVLLAVLMFVFSNIFVSCTTDEYDAEMEKQVKVEKLSEELEAQQDTYYAKEGDEDNTSNANNATDSTDPIVSDPKRD